MEVQVETAGGLTRRLHVTIPADRFEREVGERLKRLAGRARVPGFRPGKAPLKVIQQQYGADARNDAVGELVRQTWPEALTQSTLQPASSPNFNVTAEAVGQPLVYELDADLKPIRHYYLGDPAAIAAAQAAVANQGKANAGAVLLSSLVFLLITLGAAQAAPAKPTERSKQKLQAEAERAGLQQKLNELKRDIGKTESAREDAADTLAESEEAISNANRSLRELTEEQTQTNVRLQTLGEERARLQATVELQKQQLAKLLREQYVAGNEDRIKLLLSGDNPNRINRDLQLMAYVSQAQARLLESLRANLRAAAARCRWLRPWSCGPKFA
eukprot:gene43341-53811_t